MPAELPAPRQFSLGVTLDPCADGLLVKTIDRRGALGRTGRVVRARRSVPLAQLKAPAAALSVARR